MTPGTLATLNTSYSHRSRIPLYKRENNLNPTGFLHEDEICAVTDEVGVQNQIVTCRGAVGWIHRDWLKACK